MNIEAANQDSTPLPLRNDTILGVCEAIGREVGFNPTWLRIAFAGLLFVNPVAVIAAYLGLGVVVGLLHLLIRDPRPATAGVSQPLLCETPEPVEAANQSDEQVSLPAAA